MKIIDHFEGIYRIYPNLIKENQKMSTCHRLDLQTLISQPIMPKILPNHFSKLLFLPCPGVITCCPRAMRFVALFRKGVLVTCDPMPPLGVELSLLPHESLDEVELSRPILANVVLWISLLRGKMKCIYILENCIYILFIPFPFFCFENRRPKS
jgi:hypothetical protein